MPISNNLWKYDVESRIFDVDFSQQPEIINGATISSSAVSATPTGLTLGSPSVSGSKVNVLISSGTGGTPYTLLFTATTNQGAVMAAVVTLLVEVS